MCKNFEIKDFTALSLDEHKKILSWRNSEFVSRWMINKHISLDEHLEFIKSLKNSNKKYYLVGDIGVIYFTLYRDYAEIGLYKNPEKKKIGKCLMETLLKKAKEMNLKKLILYVYENNETAIALYKKFGFLEDGKYKNLKKMIKKSIK